MHPLPSRYSRPPAPIQTSYVPLPRAPALPMSVSVSCTSSSSSASAARRTAPKTAPELRMSSKETVSLLLSLNLSCTRRALGRERKRGGGGGGPDVLRGWEIVAGAGVFDLGLPAGR
eukprot:scaffold2619_cov123-Isochrysis_galbana.AAC.9